jgi:hypothetical protein
VISAFDSWLTGIQKSSRQLPDGNGPESIGGPGSATNTPAALVGDLLEGVGDVTAIPMQALGSVTAALPKKRQESSRKSARQLPDGNGPESTGGPGSATDMPAALVGNLLEGVGDLTSIPLQVIGSVTAALPKKRQEGGVAAEETPQALGVLVEGLLNTVGGLLSAP